MRSVAACLFAVFLIGGVVTNVSAQAVSDKPSKIKLTAEKLKDMKARWSQNRSKLKACRKDVKIKGLVGDDRWFYIEDCMGKT